MGVNIGPLVTKEDLNIDSLNSRSIAVDAYNIIYQFLSIIRQRDGTPLMDSQGEITSHLSGLFYRNLKLMEKGLKLVYVFDGKPPQWKSKTIDNRQNQKEEAYNKWQKALKRGDLISARKYAQATGKITKNIVKESKELLNALGIPYVEAPAEGEAQAAVMAKEGIVEYSASQDYDSLLFGTPKLIRNLTLSGRRKLPGRNSYVEVKPEKIELKKTLENLGINQRKLIWIGLLTGTDYNDGVKGIGPKKGLRLVKSVENIEELHEKSKAEEPIDYWRELELFFLNPNIKKLKKEELKFGKINEGKIIELLCEKHEFSKDRINAMIRELRENRVQNSLSRWL